MSNTITEMVLFRGNYLLYSLSCEHLTSFIISKLVDIDDFENSKTLGNKGTSLSFNQRIDFLIDMKVLNQNEKAKFQTFMEIRNQLMHNIDASSYEKCFQFLPSGKDKWILKQYPQQKNISKEESLESASLNLAKEVFGIVTNMYTSVEKKERKDKIAPDYKKRIEAYEQIHLEIENVVDKAIAKRINKSKSKQFFALKGIGQEVANIIKEKFKYLSFEEKAEIIEKKN